MAAWSQHHWRRTCARSFLLHLAHYPITRQLRNFSMESTWRRRPGISLLDQNYQKSERPLPASRRSLSAHGGPGHIAARKHNREVNWQETNTPSQWQFPLRLIDLTSPFLPQVAPKRPRGKQPRPPRRRVPAEMPVWALSLQLDPEPSHRGVNEA